MAALPGVIAVTYSSDALLSSSSSSSDYQLEGGPHIHVNLLDTGPDFFETMDIAMLAGRGFTPAEFATKRPVAIVNKTFARKYGRNPLGLHFSESAKSPRYEIVGVVSDAKYSSPRAGIEPTAYFPFEAGAVHFEIRSERNASAIAPDVSKILHDLAPDVPVASMLTQTEQIDETLVIERLLARLSAAFGLLALTLACIGLYGLLSYDVTRRTREIGIRMAVGAAPHRLKWGVLAETFGIVLMGLAVGIPAAEFSTRALAAVLYGIGTNDAATFSGIAVVLLIFSGIAGYLPARRAALVDPMVALRSE
jgi:ABC-type antimicrobial peptide transport system permease subunit